MGKLEKQVEEMYSMMKEMKDKVNNMDFQMVQMMQVVQGGGAVRGPLSLGYIIFKLMVIIM